DGECRLEVNLRAFYANEATCVAGGPSNRSGRTVWSLMVYSTVDSFLARTEAGERNQDYVDSRSGNYWKDWPSTEVRHIIRDST
ncbi:MAG: hypothetical protein AB1486_11245, partial [Planctomycetota bacterium]